MPCLLGTHNCAMEANCISKHDQFTCECKTGFQSNGRKCFDRNECRENKSICGKNALFMNNIGSYACKCNAGFMDSDEHVDFCVDINECKIGNPCDENARCINKYGSFTCEYNKGFNGDGYSCESVNECKLGIHNCDVNALFINIDEPPFYLCSCKEGYMGYGQECLEADECELGIHECHELASCTNTPGSYTCQ